jgi:putative peptidoglycan lipid II flippase
LLPTGGVSALVYAQTLYLLPVSLFGMSVSAAELPAMSSAVGSAEEIAVQLRRRLNNGLRQIALFIVPSAIAFLTLGDVLASAVYQSGKFTAADTLYVWATLAGSTIGLLAQTLGRLYASTFYATHDTRTPLKFALLRVFLTTVLGYIFALQLPGLIGIAAIWGVAGLTSSAGIAAWIEFLLLRRALNRRIGATGLELSYQMRLWSAAILAAAAGYGVKLAVGASMRPLFRAMLVFAPYGIVYFGILMLLGTPEVSSMVRRFKRGGSERG